MPRRATDSPAWGGKRPGTGRPRKYVKIPVRGHIERSERAPLTPESDLTICIAEMDDEGRRGIVIGDIWYGAAEARAIAEFVKKHRKWLQTSPAAPS